MFKGMLNGSGEFSDRSPRYCEGGRSLTRDLGVCSADVEEGTTDLSFCSEFINSTVVKRATVFP
jgi:hypothetical protein